MVWFCFGGVRVGRYALLFEAFFAVESSREARFKFLLEQEQSTKVKCDRLAVEKDSDAALGKQNSEEARASDAGRARWDVVLLGCMRGTVAKCAQSAARAV